LGRQARPGKFSASRKALHYGALDVMLNAGDTLMSDGPDNLVLRFMRQVDAKLDRVIDDLSDIKVRVTNVEENLVALNRRVDRIDLRVERIERRFDLVGGPV
jgi:hypothetical protein